MESKEAVMPIRKKWVPKNRIGGPVKREKNTRKKLTNPAMYVNPAAAVKQYQNDSLEKRAAVYYEQAGQRIPEFDKMDKIQKLEALNDARQLAIQAREKLRDIDTRDIERSQQKAKADAAAAERAAGTAHSGKDSGGPGKDK